MSILLHKVLKNSYHPKPDAFKGYTFDNELSNHNQQVYYNPNEKDNKKLLYSVTGTHNLKDWGTSLYGALGMIKKTNRYKEAKDTLTKAKQKYNTNNATISGHSLGGQISGYIGNKDDKVLTLDKAASPFQKMRSNENSYRSKGDIVSLLNANSKRTKTIGDKQYINPLKAHDVDNIKDSNIYIYINCIVIHLII